jgi:transposase
VFPQLDQKKREQKMNTKKTVNFEGKTVFVGIDVHKKKYHITAIMDQLVIKKCTTLADPEQVAHSLKSWFFGAAKVFTAYEAGFCGFGFHRKLMAHGIHSIVVNPASIEIAANDRVKTDARDSEKIARHLAAGNLRGVNIPTEKQELSRLYQRTRQQFRDIRTMLGNQIKSKLFQFGFIAPEDDRVMSLAYLKRVQALSLPEELQITIEALIVSWKNIYAEILKLNRKIKAQNALHSDIQRIQTVPGIGELTSNILYTELGDMQQFPNERSLFSFLGLTPCEYSSGEKQRKGHITRQGPGRLRHILVEITWRTIRVDSGLRAVYTRIAQHRGGKRAIVACARKLAGRIRSCLIQQQDYRYEAIMA